MTAWHCTGIPPHTPPCDASGTTDHEAAQHTAETQHSTSTHGAAVERGTR